LNATDAASISDPEVAAVRALPHWLQNWPESINPHCGHPIEAVSVLPIIGHLGWQTSLGYR
jgi:hypothetical protein